MRRLLAATAALPVALPLLASAQEAAAPDHGAKVWIGEYATYEEYLRTAPIDKVKNVGQGVTKPKRAYFAKGGLAASAIVKPLSPQRKKGYWESYKSEIAAYELDRLLGLDMVPVTVERVVGGDKTSVQLWVNDCKLLKDMGKKRPASPVQWGKQVDRQKVFDALIANIDRNAGNILVDEDWNMVLIDHSRAFASDETPFLDNVTRCDKNMYERLKALDEPLLMEKLKPWLFEDKSVRALLKRRDKIVEKLEGLAAERGELAVFFD